jgi:hypothetical protein
MKTSRIPTYALSLLAWSVLLAPFSLAADNPRLLDVRKIAGTAPHSAFTDLIRHNDRFYCVFREGKTHVSPDGSIRILTSPDGRTWESAANITSDTADLRDPKISVMPDGKLLLLVGAALHGKGDVTHQSWTYTSSDGKKWDGPAKVGDDNFWLWRLTWHDGTAYGVGYSTARDVKGTRLYATTNGTMLKTIVPELFQKGYPNEHAMRFNRTGTAWILLRRDGSESSARLGIADPPYDQWQWHDLGIKIGGPAMIDLPDGRIIVAARLYDQKTRTSLCWLDATTEKLVECLPLPSAGDSSYPGLVLHGGKLYVSYYSSHEGKTSIYFATVEIP